MMSGGKVTVTRERFVQAMRNTVSPDFFDRNIPYDKRSLWIEPVIVERFYPETNEARVTYRDTMGDDGKESVSITVMVGSPFISDDLEIIVFPDGDLETCPYTGKESIVLEENSVVGAVMSFKGDHNSKGSILLCYVHMPGEGNRGWNSNIILLRNKNSTIKIFPDQIDIDVEEVEE